MSDVADVLSLPVSNLVHDACIIDEQDSHLVLAVKIPRRTIAENHALLMALSERVASVPSPSIAPLVVSGAEPAKPRWRRYAYPAMLLAAIALPSPFIPLPSMANHQPPVEYTNWKAAQPSFKPDEDIEFLVDYRRNRECLAIFDRAIHRKSDGVIIYSNRIYGGISPPTDGEWKTIKTMVRPTAPLKPGRYEFSGHSQHQCEQGGTYNISRQRVPFTVAE